MPPILPQFIVSFLLIYWPILTRFFSDQFYAHALEHNQNHLLVKLAQSLDFSELEKACAPFHHQRGAGRPERYPVSLLIRAFLVGYLYDYSLRELEQGLYSDLIVRWFVGLKMLEDAPDHTTLERFHQWVTHNQPELFFSVVIKQMERRFPEERTRAQIGDSYAMRANAADEGLVRRMRRLSKYMLVGLLKAMPLEVENCLRGFAWERLFGSYPERIDYFLNEKQRLERLHHTALAAYELHQRVESLLSGCSVHQHLRVRRWLGYLHKVLQDEFSFQTNAAGENEVTELPKKDKGSFRLISATDPEATLRIHDADGKDLTLGYNIQLAITTSGMIQETRAYTGADPDQSGVVNLVAAQMERDGSCPARLIYDKAGGSGKTREELIEATQGQCTLSARLPAYELRSDRFGPYDFTYTEDPKTLTCPNGKVSHVNFPSPQGEGVIFRFYFFQCWNGVLPNRNQSNLEEALPQRCPLWEQCRDPKQGSRSMRPVFISDYRNRVLEARQYNLTEAFEQEMKLRPRVERVIFELTHYNGARRCRRIGLDNADFQAKMCATAYNLKLWMRRLRQNAAAGK